MTGSFCYIKKHSFVFIILFISVCSADNNTRSAVPLKVQTGLDVMIGNSFKSLRGKRVGLLTNHSARSKDGRHIADILYNSEHVNLVALFGPEHGIRGTQPGGVTVNSTEDSLTGLPVYSLYTNNKKPTEQMLAGLDVMVFDIQDVGARFYTYIYSMAYAMEAAAKYKKQFIVLDRPNPISGAHLEGPVLREGFESFVGLYKIPVRHAMTVGELAMMFKGEKWVAGADSLDLQVIAMTHWKRPYWLDQTDVPWIAPSPNMLSLATATVYPGTCLIEGTNVSEGRGSDKPFENIGAPWVDAAKLAQEMNRQHLAGVRFEPLTFTPQAKAHSAMPKFKGQVCSGVFIRVTERRIFQPVRTGIALISTLKNLYPQQFSWSATIDRLYGSDILRKGLDQGQSMEYLFADSMQGLDAFKGIRKKYLMYPE